MFILYEMIYHGKGLFCPKKLPSSSLEPDSVKHNEGQKIA